MSQVTAGTVAVTNGNATVTGTGVDWSTVPATAIFYIDGDDRSYALTAAPSGSTLTLTTPYAGITNATSTYSLSTDFTPFLGLARVGNQDIGTRPLLRQIVDKIDAYIAAHPGGGGGGGNVTSVFTRAGAVVAQSGDYTASLITDTAAKVIMTAAERTKLSGIADGAQVNPVVATTADAQAGTDTVRMMTAARTKESVIQFAPGGGSGGEPAEATAGGALTTTAIAITRRQTKYNTVNQAGATNFVLNVAGSNYNLGEVIFYFVADGTALTWDASLVDARTGLNSNLPASLTVNTTSLFAIVFDEANSRGLVYWPSEVATGGGTGGAGTIQVQDEGATPLTAQPLLNFVGAGVTVSADTANGRNTITIPGGSGTGSAVPLAGGTMTGPLVLGAGARITGGGQAAGGFLSDLVRDVSGALTVAAHGNNICLVVGDVDIPQIPGFHTTLIMRGDLFVTFGNVISPQITQGNIIDIWVTDIGGLFTSVTTIDNKIIFAAGPPKVIGTPAVIAATTGATLQPFNYTLGAGANALVVCVYTDTGGAASPASAATWQATGDASPASMTGAVSATSANTYVGMYRLFNPSFGTATGAGTIRITQSGVNQMGIVAYSISGYDGGTPVTNSQIGTTMASPFDPAALALANVPSRSLIIHAAACGIEATAVTFDAAETTDANANPGVAVRIGASHKTIQTGGASGISVDITSWSQNPTRWAEIAAVFAAP